MLNEAAVRTWIVKHIAEFLDLPESAISQDQPFQTFGLDSADSILVGGALEDEFDVEIDATLFLRNDSIDALIDDLRRSGFVE